MEDELDHRKYLWWPCRLDDIEPPFEITIREYENEYEAWGVWAD